MPPKADIEKPVTLVRPSNAKAVQSVLDRAHKQERAAAKQVTRTVAKAMRPVRSKGLLSKTLGIALSHHGRTKKNAPSIRPVAPDTKGRSFHFSHSTVGKGPAGGGSKASAGPAPGQAQSTGTATGGTGSTAAPATSSGAKPSKYGSREAGHQSYVERDIAVARDATETFGHAVGQSATIDSEWVREPIQSRDGQISEVDQVVQQKDGIEAGEPDRDHARPIEMDVEAIKKEIARDARDRNFESAKAGQEYMEDPEKVAPQTRHGHSNSFGTIGATFEERIAYWNDVNTHEREKDARTQIRLVLELPHEATPEARQEIVKKHCEQYEALGVPYWASIHAPTNKNDDRNFHAHIVHGIRPARKMKDPETGRMAWDFTVVKSYKTTCRHTKKSHPHRQNVVAAFRDRDYVRESRKRFAETANTVLAKHGCDVRYDARSYKDMGLDIEPMKHVARIIADKTSKRDFVVMDAEWTRRMIAREMQIAALGRDETYLKLKAAEQRIVRNTRDLAKLNDANRKLPKGMKISPFSKMTSQAAKTIAGKMLVAERDRLEQRFADEATARTLQHVIDATAPTSAHRDGKERQKAEPRYAAANPSERAMAALHTAAVEEMRLHRIATAGRATRSYHRAKAALGEWQTSASHKPQGLAAGTTRQTETTKSRQPPPPVRIAAPIWEMRERAPKYEAHEVIPMPPPARAPQPEPRPIGPARGIPKVLTAMDLLPAGVRKQVEEMTARMKAMASMQPQGGLERFRAVAEYYDQVQERNRVKETEKPVVEKTAAEPSSPQAPASDDIRTTPGYKAFKERQAAEERQAEQEKARADEAQKAADKPSGERDQAAAKRNGSETVSAAKPDSVASTEPKTMTRETIQASAVAGEETSIRQVEQTTKQPAPAILSSEQRTTVAPPPAGEKGFPASEKPKAETGSTMQVSRPPSVETASNTIGKKPTLPKRVKKPAVADQMACDLRAKPCDFITEKRTPEQDARMRQRREEKAEDEARVNEIEDERDVKKKKFKKRAMIRRVMTTR